MAEAEQLPPVTVVLAVYEPDETFLAAQLDSLKAQSHPVDTLVAVIADGTSEPLVHSLAEHAGWSLDIVRPEERTGSYRSFEIGLRRALEIAPAASLFAFCDQDDIWHGDKLAILAGRHAASGVSLVHSDARLIDAADRVLHPSLFRQEKRRLSDDPRRLLLRNCVTGMTALFDRETAVASLPFPAQAALFFHHDLWLALVASALRGISAVERPLVDYRQHGENVVGAISGWERTPPLFSKAWMRHWVGSYAVATYLAKSLYLRMEDVTAAGTGEPDRRRLDRLHPYLNETSAGFRLLGDGLRATVSSFGLARQSIMFGAVQMARLGWACRACLGNGMFDALSSFDSKAFSLAPGAQPERIATATPAPKEVWSVGQFRDERMHRKFETDLVGSLSGRVVIMLPSLNPSEIFAGIATAIDIGLGLAERGQEVVFVATDLPIASLERTRAFVLGRAERRAKPAPISFFCGVTQARFDISPQDRFVATAWWSAHVIQSILDENPVLGADFLYLIQDYEPGFYAWGSEYTAAAASYELQYTPIFNTALLRDFFHTRGFGAADGREFVFQPSIDIGRYARLKRPRRDRRRLVLYGRPEVARNLFPVAIEAIHAFLEAEALGGEEVELLSVGLAHPDVAFPGGHILRSLGKIPWDDYPDFLSTVDVGLSLMFSPHPSHPPLEMAAAGARVVTNICATKDLGELARHIYSVDPTAGAVSTALSMAWAAKRPTKAERTIDLSPLGPPMHEMLDELSAYLSQDNWTPLAKSA